MKGRIRNLAVLSVLVGLGILGWYHSSQADENGTHPGKRHGAGIYAALGLSDEQKTKVKEIFRKYRPAIRPVIAQLRTERHEMRKLIHEETVDEKAIRTQAEKMAGTNADLAVQRAYVFQEIRRILTKEQIEKLTMREDEADPDRFMSGFPEDNAKE